MLKIKDYLLHFLMFGQSVSKFEKWIYEQNSIEFEKLISEDAYLELIIIDFKNISLQQVGTN